MSQQTILDNSLFKCLALQATTAIMSRESKETFEDIHSLLQKSFLDGKMHALSFRKEQLRILQKFLTENEESITEAIYSDIQRPYGESKGILTRVKNDINYLIEELPRMAEGQVLTPQLPAPVKVLPSPKGVVLIYGAYNAPVMLAVQPLAAAIAAGNCAVLKPSEVAPATEAVLERMMASLDDTCFAIVTGGPDVAKRLMNFRWDHVLFTGSSDTGRVIMQAAARHLTPVTLELGGKNPTFVSSDVDLAAAALSIVIGRMKNAGQVCLCPVRLLQFFQIHGIANFESWFKPTNSLLHIP